MNKMMLLFAAAVTLVGCADEPSECEVQCALHRDCGLFSTDADEATCVSTCDQMLDGRCVGPGCFVLGAGADPARCIDHLLEANALADDDRCTGEFVNAWCSTYYDDPSCAPLDIGGIRCQ